LSRINGIAYALSEYLTFYNTLSIMKRKLLLVFCIHIGSLCCWAQVYRWDAKILIDTAGLRIYKIKAKTETISNLADGAATPRPEKNELQKGKRANAEKRKVTVTAYIVATGREDDGDYHLVCKALNSKRTLIAEIPNPETPKLKGFPGLKADYTKARDEIDNKIGVPPGQVKELERKWKVRITGIVFFDKMAHGNGHAVNGIEIHPIISIKVLE
jgi:hypothetical protein